MSFSVNRPPPHQSSRHYHEDAAIIPTFDWMQDATRLHGYDEIEADMIKMEDFTEMFCMVFSGRIFFSENIINLYRWSNDKVTPAPRS